VSFIVEMTRVIFLHPDLGIGGAERAVIDAALALKSRGHHVHMVTSHHDPSHCFEETRDGRLSVTCVGDWLPRSLFGRFRAMCAYVRMIYAALYLVFVSSLRYDVIFCDQISACIPFLRCRCSAVKVSCFVTTVIYRLKLIFVSRVLGMTLNCIHTK